MHHYTYMITDILTNKFYVGVRSSKCKPEDDINYMSSSKIVKELIKNNGKENFIKMIMDEFPTRELANEAEEDFLTRNNAGYNTLFYNQTNGNNKFCTFGISPTEEHINHLAELSRQRWANGEMQSSIDATKKRWAEGKMKNVLTATRKIGKRGLKGDDRTPAQKAHDASDLNKHWLGKKRPEFSSSIKGRDNHMFGKKHSEESKEAISKKKLDKDFLMATNTSGKSGVCVTKDNTFKAYITKDGATKYIGTFATFEEALKQRELAECLVENGQFESIKTIKEKECPHCRKIGKGGNMTRYHFDNCKHKESEGK